MLMLSEEALVCCILSGLLRRSSLRCCLTVVLVTRSLACDGWASLALRNSFLILEIMKLILKLLAF